MAININSVTNANVYLDDSSLLGQAKEVQVPENPFKMVDHEAVGMAGMVELFAGLDKMESTIQWNSFYPEALKKSVNPNAPFTMQVRASMRQRNSAGLTGEVPVVITMTAQPKNIPGFNFKQHENVEAESKYNISYLKLEIDSAEIYEIDLLANVFKVDGVDLLAKYRQNLGV